MSTILCHIWSKLNKQNKICQNVNFSIPNLVNLFKFANPWFITLGRMLQ